MGGEWVGRECGMRSEDLTGAARERLSQQDEATPQDLSEVHGHSSRQEDSPLHCVYTL